LGECGIQSTIGIIEGLTIVGITNGDLDLDANGHWHESEPTIVISTIPNSTMTQSPIGWRNLPIVNRQ
jgi:hypothetical protein